MTLVILVHFNQISDFVHQLLFRWVFFRSKSLIAIQLFPFLETKSVLFVFIALESVCRHSTQVISKGNVGFAKVRHEITIATNGSFRKGFKFLVSPRHEITCLSFLIPLSLTPSADLGGASKRTIPLSSGRNISPVRRTMNWKMAPRSGFTSRRRAP